MIPRYQIQWKTDTRMPLIQKNATKWETRSTFYFSQSLQQKLNLGSVLRARGRNVLGEHVAVGAQLLRQFPERDGHFSVGDDRELHELDDAGRENATDGVAPHVILGARPTGWRVGQCSRVTSAGVQNFLHYLQELMKEKKWIESKEI